MAHIVIISEEPLFSEVMADTLSRELGHTIDSVKNILSFNVLSGKNVDILVTTQVPPAEWIAKSLYYPAGKPRKITHILGDITQKLSPKSSDSLYLTDSVALHEKSKTLERTDTGRSVDLTEKEQALLLFIRAEGEAGRDEILRHVWGVSPDVTTSTLETHMYRLRQKWRELAEDDCIIATEKGYRWNEHCA